MSVLELPIEKQRKMAKRSNMSLEEWQEDVRETLRLAKEFTAQLTEGEVTEEVQAYLDRCDSQTVGFKKLE